MRERLKLFFAHIFLLNQLSIYGAVSDLCEEYKACQARTGRPVLAGQSDPLFVPNVMKTHIHTFDRWSCARRSIATVQRTSGKALTTKSCDKDLYWCRIPNNSWSRTVLHDQGHWRVPESVECREYTSPRDEQSSDPKGWIRGNTKIGPVLEVTTSYLLGENGVEIRIESVNKDNSHSWVRISHGLNMLVTDLIDKEHDDNEQETSEMKFEEFALKTNVLALASRSKAKAKPRRRTSASSSTRTVPICARSWTDVEPGIYSLIAYPVSKRLSTLLRHGDLPREEDGAIEFWRLKDCLRYEFENSRHWSDEKWKSTMAKGGGNKKKFNIVVIHQDKKFFTSELFKVILDAISLILHYRTMY